MKNRKVSTLIFTGIVLGSVFLASNGFAYDIADHYPLAQGFTWTYQKTTNA